MADALRITQVEGRAIPVRGNDIDTDRIMPARFLRSVTFEGLEKHVFVDDRAEATRQGTPHAFDQPQYAGASILVVNHNFGCGSSREHAPQGLHRWGIRAIVGESFSEIFFGNSVMLGLPCVTAPHADIERLMAAIEANPETHVQVDLVAGTCQAGSVTFSVSIPANVRDALATGAWDTTGLLLERYGEVDATAGRLPYVNNFV
ncbi:MAG: 3-isopropylmalate dehydratase small subunit [Vicinamibacterales bacterium]